MSLFVINRYLGDEVTTSEDRSKALLQKLHEQAKDRQQQQRPHSKEKGTPKSNHVEETDKTISTETETSRKTKKRKKKQEEEVKSPSENEQDSQLQEATHIKEKKQTKKKKIIVEEKDESPEHISEHDERSRAEQESSKTEEESRRAEEESSRAKEIEPSGAEVTTSNPNSILLGGFEPKAVEKVLPVLPQWLTQPSFLQKNIKQNLVPIHDIPGLHPKVLKKLEVNKVKDFFPVQAEVIPAVLDSSCHGFLLGKGGYRPSDVCVSAPTGSGKTLAFVIPIVQTLLQRVVCEVRALVVLPTKELAQQVCKVFNTYVDGMGLKVVMIAGQKSFLKEQESLIQKTAFGFSSLADILVCTPGRLVDHIQQTEGFNLRHLRFLVIDEADRMIDSMNQDWLNHVTKAVFRLEAGSPNMLFTRKEPGILTAASSCLHQTPLQKLLFSATLTQNPEKLKQLGLYQPRLFISKQKGNPNDSSETQMEPSISGNFSLPEGLTHYYIPCNLNSKPLILLHFLLSLRFSRVLCFTNSRDASHRLYLLIRSFGGIDVAEFSSRLSPGERKRTLKEFEQGKVQLLVSTDATARGIDIKGVKCIINYDAPQFIRTYVHRVGRTARAGKAGLAFTMLLKVQEKPYFGMLRDAGAPELQRQLVKSECLKQYEQRYEEALSELQKAVKNERAQKRS
ncbi:DEAD-box helicase 51 L homeolog [Xenopus laevis]|uniref:ATP-dependent RNA helicase n=1 Tax=Xenopus laevis TaxID=8355 RepID=B1H1U3_XENLA|nr:DEAD-box helicase 51 L homeolog [Xenopus laevis]AAI60740.1 LOC100158308 protein [Xenopus laevis]